MKSTVERHVSTRIESEITARSAVKYLKEHKVSEYLDVVINAVYTFTRPKKGKIQGIYFSEVISAIGHGVRNKLGLKKDSSLAAKTGGFLLWSFEDLGYLRVIMGGGHNGHHTYIVETLNDEAICELWSKLSIERVQKLPSLTPYAPWICARHESGAKMVKTNNKDVLALLNPESHPIVFDTINKAQAVGWNVNKDVHNIAAWALKNRTDAFADIWELSNMEAKASKTREAQTIVEMAKKFVGKTFYHLYYFDFRGRKYPGTAYLHEQGTDLARGLLLRADVKGIGKDGFFWLLVSIASNWAGDAGRADKAKTDKIPLSERAGWAISNEEILLAYAEAPKVHQGWMKADKPWQFLAACMELMKFRIWQGANDAFDSYDFESGLECYIDGSNNGSQHLSALTRDEITAPHVNLVPLDLPGDLYKYVGDHVWDGIGRTVESMDSTTVEQCQRYIDQLIEYKKEISNAEPKSDARKVLVEAVRAYREENSEIAGKAAPVFWMRVTDAKHRRKVVKRNVMTLPYGGTSYGLGEQQISDAKKHGIDLLYNMEHKWGAYMGREVYEDCRVSLKRPMQLLEVFEMAGRKAEMASSFLSWMVPVTGFPVVQHYTEGVVKKFWIQYGPPKGLRLNTGYFENTYQIYISVIEDQVPSKGKQAQGASPNAIHSLDAAHLSMTVAAADFPITTIHDSFGCLLSDMPRLFTLVREQFVKLYQSDPLSSLMKDIDGDISDVEFGTLDITLVKDSEYCFA